MLLSLGRASRGDAWWAADWGGGTGERGRGAWMAGMSGINQSRQSGHQVFDQNPYWVSSPRELRLWKSRINRDGPARGMNEWGPRWEKRHNTDRLQRPFISSDGRQRQVHPSPLCAPALMLLIACVGFFFLLRVIVQLLGSNASQDETHL